MSDEKSNIIKAYGQLTLGAIALAVLTYALWLGAQERRFEAARADTDRQMVMDLTKSTNDQILESVARQEARAERFLQSMEVIAVATDTQAELLREISASNKAADEAVLKKLKIQTERQTHHFERLQEILSERKGEK